MSIAMQLVSCSAGASVSTQPTPSIISCVACCEAFGKITYSFGL